MSTLSVGGAAPVRHRLTLTRSQDRTRTSFRGRCDCGASSGQQSAAGLVHGWHGAHVDAARGGAR